jgi:hypothetical protein
MSRDPFPNDPEIDARAERRFRCTATVIATAAATTGLPRRETRDIGKCTRLPAFMLRFGSQQECAS